ncbi:MAG: 3-phosphoshikimate 1-carboxyvinyltransferase [Phycisphaerales bacterium]|nr:3-phosphoshikimate 1-carboxyvinyltransferase [Phycisphaerales bacterium]
MTESTDVNLRPAAHPVDQTICLPGSKSLTNRALLTGALASGDSQIDGLLLADDTRHMLQALRQLGIEITVDETRRRATIMGCRGHWPESDADLFCGNAGTAIRFLTAACCTGHGAYRLDGVRRMRERPIGALVDALRDLGANIGYEEQEGYCPLTIRGRGLRGGQIRFSTTLSSQYVSALLLASPLAANDVMIDVTGSLPSKPYVAMTLKVMHDFGVQTVEEKMERFIVPCRQTYTATRFDVEPDASAASYFFAAAAVTGGRVTVDGLGLESCQGDVNFVNVLERMGCRVEQGPRHTTVWGPSDGKLRGVDEDLNDMPDMAQTLAVLAAFADGPTRIRNVTNLRIKETDRLFALSTELGKMNVPTEVHEDGLSIQPHREPTATAIDTYEDHRMAMSFALAGLRLDGMVIRDADCVNKTFPEFFELWTELVR